MRVHIQVSGFTLTEEIQAYFDARVSKIEKLLANDPTAQIDARLERKVTHSAGESFFVELTITGAHMAATAHGEEMSMHAAIDMAEDRALSELRKSKGKRVDSVRRGAARIKDFLRGFRE